MKTAITGPTFSSSERCFMIFYIVTLMSLWNCCIIDSFVWPEKNGDREAMYIEIIIDIQTSNKYITTINCLICNLRNIIRLQLTGKKNNILYLKQFNVSNNLNSILGLSIITNPYVHNRSNYFGVQRLHIIDVYLRFLRNFKH